MKLQVGQALASVVDATAVVVVRAPAEEVSLTCGGQEMVPKGQAGEPVAADPAHLGGSVLGKRYVDDGGVLEVLCVAGGEASLALDGQPLSIQSAKPLPASD